MVDRQASQPMRALGDITEFDGLTTKKQILSVLLEFCESNSICLDSPVVQLEQSFKDFKREKVLLNDIAFVPHEEYIWRNELFGETLGRLCRTLGGAAEEEGMKEKILKNACRTGSGADAFFVIQKLLCIPGTFMAQRSCSDDPPVKIDMFKAADGRVCCRVVSVNSFSIFDSNMQIDMSLDIPPAWLVVTAYIYDELIFGGEHRRWLTFTPFCPSPTPDVSEDETKADDDFPNLTPGDHNRYSEGGRESCSYGRLSGDGVRVVPLSPKSRNNVSD